MSNIKVGNRVAFKKSRWRNVFRVLEITDDGKLTLQGPYRRRFNIDHTRVEKVTK